MSGIACRHGMARQARQWDPGVLAGDPRVAPALADDR